MLVLSFHHPAHRHLGKDWVNAQRISPVPKTWYMYQKNKVLLVREGICTKLGTKNMVRETILGARANQIRMYYFCWYISCHVPIICFLFGTRDETYQETLYLELYANIFWDSVRKDPRTVFSCTKWEPYRKCWYISSVVPNKGLIFGTCTIFSSTRICTLYFLVHNEVVQMYTKVVKTNRLCS